MEWDLPPARAGRAPQASRHSNRAELVLGASGREVEDTAGGLVVMLAAVADVAAGFGAEGGFGVVAGSVRALLAQAPTIDAKPTLPASRSS